MKKRIRFNSDRPQGKLTIIPDFLPPAEELFRPYDVSKVKFLLRKDNIAFFKRMARRIGLPYQQLLREVLMRYARPSSKKRAA